MMAEIGLPAAAALVLEPNAGLLALMGAAAVTHHATAVKDVRVAYESPRQILPAEQHVHAFLEVLPWQALAMIATLNWDQLRALAGRSPQRADWRLRRKRRPLSRGYIAAVTGSVLIFIGMPYGEELVRCLRSARP
jgi:hypothetical protein